MEPRVKVRVRLPPEMREALARLAHYEGRSLNGQVLWLVQQELAREAERDPKLREILAAGGAARPGGDAASADP